MKIELHIEEDSLNTRKIEALLISKADLDRLEEKLPGSCELYRDNEVSEATKSEVYQLTGHGNEPLGEVQTALREALPHWDGNLPADLGYDTDADGVGYNSIYLVVEEEVNEYTAIYRVNRQYLTDAGEQVYGHYAIVGDSPKAVLAEVQEDSIVFDAGGIWKGDTLLYLIVRECDEQRNIMTDKLILAETGTIADDEAMAIRRRYEELSARGLMPTPVRSIWELCAGSEEDSQEGGIDELLGEGSEDYLPTPGEPLDKYTRKGGER